MRHFGRTAELLDRRQAVLDVHQSVLYMPSARIRMRRRHHSTWYTTVAVAHSSSPTSARRWTGNGRGWAIGERVKRFSWHGTGATNGTPTMMRMWSSIFPRWKGTARWSRWSGWGQTMTVMVGGGRWRCQVIGAGSHGRRGRWAGTVARYGRRLGVVWITGGRWSRRSRRAHRVQAVRLGDSSMGWSSGGVMMRVMPSHRRLVQRGLVERMVAAVRIVHRVGARRGYHTAGGHSGGGPTLGAHWVAAGRLLDSPSARGRGQTIDPRSTNDAAKGQQSLGHRTLNGLHKAAAADDAVATWRCLHGGPGIDADHTFVLLGGWRIRLAFLLQFTQ